MTVLFVVLLAALLAVVATFRTVWTRPSRWRHLAVRVSLLGFTLAWTFMALEVAAYHFLVQSDGFAFTLAAQRWFAEYWGPLNQQGYRDREHGDLSGQRVALVVGDSFVAGHGIEDRADRFPDVLQTLLGSDWSVLNIARNGWSTVDELEAIAAAPDPEVIVLSYYINDVEGAAWKHGHTPPPALLPPPELIRPLVERSHLANFVYWRLARSGFHRDLRDTYFAFLRQSYTSPVVWKTHREELRQVVAMARERDALLVVVVFPFLADPESSAEITAKVVAAFESDGVPVIDLAERFRGQDPRTLVVSAIDAHPNPAVHREVAELVHNELERLLQEGREGSRGTRSPGVRAHLPAEHRAW